MLFKTLQWVRLVWPEVRFQKLPLPERKSEGKRAMVSALGVPTVQWQHWHHPTNQPSFGLPSFDGSCLLAICRPLPRAVEVRNTVWAAVSAPHGGDTHYPGETCGMLVKLGSLSKVSLQKGWAGGLILCKLTKDVCFQKQTNERWNLTVDLWPCDV